MTTKILALTDALGNLVRFVLLPGHRFDTVGVAPLIDGLAFDGFIADKAFASAVEPLCMVFSWPIASFHCSGAEGLTKPCHISQRNWAGGQC